MKTVIIGGVAGGASAAARLRRLDETAEIIIFEKTGYISYANCGLPYYIGGVIDDEEELTLQTPESFWERFRIDVRVHTEVTAIHREKKTVSVYCRTDGRTYEESYDKLIIATGANAIRPSIEGIDSKRIFTLKTVEDTFAVTQWMDTEQPQSALVIGGGFIGVEMAENLKKRGLRVTLIDKAPQVLGQFDSDMVSFLHAELQQQGVKLLLGVGVKGFEELPDGIAAHLEHQQCVHADMAVLAIGVTPETKLAAEAGLACGLRGAIAVDAHMQTSDADIYAVGDAVAIPHLVTRESALISLAGPANKQGRVAADNLAGKESVYHGAQGSSIVKVFDLTAASTGLNERAAQAQGLACETVIISPASHASYYPHATVMTIKFLFEKESERILGAQIIGYDGVDKRLDVIATAMQAGMKASQLKRLDLSYAPPYASAKDPVNMLGFVSENLINGITKQFYFNDIPALQADKNAILLDVRTQAEYQRGYAEGFETHIPVDALRERLNELDKSKKIYVMCQSGLRSYIACRILMQNGFDAYNFAGGYRFYQTVKANQFDKTTRTDCGVR